MPLVAAGLGLIDDFQGAKHIVCVGIDNLPPVHDAFSRLDDARRDRDALQQLPLYLLRHLFVVGDVFRQIVVDVARLQQRLVQFCRAIVDDELIVPFFPS